MYINCVVLVCDCVCVLMCVCMCWYNCVNVCVDDLTDAFVCVHYNDQVPAGADPKIYICKHKIGRGIIHRGSHTHGALDVGDGERYNLIVWMRSSSVRNQLCPRCKETPNLHLFEGYGDGFVIANNY